MSDANEDASRYRMQDGGTVLPDPRVAKLEAENEQIRAEQTEAKRRDEKYKNDQLEINRKVKTFTLLLVICSVVASGINFYQSVQSRRSADAAVSAATAASNTLDEIRKSGTDTHALAEAAGKQADAALKIAESNRISAETAQRMLANERPDIVLNVVRAIPDKGGLGYEVSLINSGSLGATDFMAVCEMFLDDERVVGDKEFPTPFYFGKADIKTICEGHFGEATVKRLFAGSRLDFYIHAKYNGPHGHYNYCIEQRFSTILMGFGVVGGCDASKPFPQGAVNKPSN